MCRISKKKHLRSMHVTLEMISILFSILTAVLLVVSVCQPVSVWAQDASRAEMVENRQVLFISSYSYTWSTVPLQLEGIQSVLDPSVTLDIEFMDTKEISLDLAEQMLFEKIQYKQKYAKSYDAVIVGDDAALVFAMKYREELFADIPIVFEGINNIEYAKEVSEDPLVTGVIERFSYGENLDFAQKIQPDAKNVVAIVDNTVTGIGEQQQFFAQEDNYPELSFDVINSSLLTKQQIIDRISDIDTDTILIYLILSEDVEGHVYTNEQVCQMLKEYAHVPVLRFVQAGIGEGVLGGNIVLHRESGEIAAGLVMQIFEGADPASIDMVDESPNGYYLDQEVLDRFGISKSLIPDGAEMINQKLSFWEKYGVELIVTVCVSAAVMVITLLCMRAVYDRRRYEELEKANQQLETAAIAAQAATRAKSIFLHSMSHDIRTPMNAIIGFTNIALKRNKDAAIGEYLQKIMTSSKHLLALISEVLDISRIENGQVVYEPVPVDICAVTRDVQSMMQGFASEKEILLRTDILEADQKYMVLADPVRVREVLANILSNALKFTESGGTIQFSMNINPGSDENHAIVRYTISDTGCGMSEEFLPHVFDEFVQEATGARTQYQGTGLGMTITKHYVDMMGGTIQVKSKVGEGTTFVVELPLELTSSDDVVIQKSPDGRKDLKGLHVLMAEDNDLNAEIMAAQLQEMGMQLVRATDGRQVVETFANHPPGTFDVILMDIMMPEMDGYEATHMIRSMDTRPDGRTIPIIAMTANAFTEDVQASLDAGMNAHLTKPVVMDDVLKTISDLML